MNSTAMNKMFCPTIHNDEFEIRLNRLRKFKNLPEQLVSNVYYGRNKLSTCVWNLDKQQDFTWSIIENEIMCAIVADGHGESTVVNWLRSKSDDYFIMICKKINPLEELEKDLLEEIDTYSSGACISLIRTNMTNNAEIFYLGDVLTQVYINGEPYKQTLSHSWENKEEIDRKTEEGATFTSEMMLTQLDEITTNPHMTMAKGLRCNHSPKDYSGSDSLQITRALGHNGTTGSNYGYLNVDFKESDDVKIVSASDGVFDVVHPNENLNEISDACQLVNFAAERWCGNWNFVHYQGHQCIRCKNKKTDETVITIQQGIPPDDISACVIHLQAN